MFGTKYTLVTAVLMTMASLAWGFNLYIASKADDVPMSNIIVVVLFAVLAAGYWTAYFRKKNTEKAGTE